MPTILNCYSWRNATQKQRVAHLETMSLGECRSKVCGGSTQYADQLRTNKAFLALAERAYVPKPTDNIYQAEWGHAAHVLASHFKSGKGF